MRKIFFFVLLFAFCMLISCSNETNKNEAVGSAFEQVNIEGAEDIDKYIIGKGYEILSYEGKIEEYKLDKKRIYNSWQIWACQYSEPDVYMGKVISTYGYKVKNHILDNESPNKKTYLSIMVCENKIIGGYSNPDCEGVDFRLIPAGGGYSLEGKNFEDVKNIDYPTWRDKYIKKYE